MTRDEALTTLGLDEGATREEIQIAHRELAQMLHPDKFSENKRLRSRAEQQMKRINEARDVLLKSVGSARRSGADGTGRSSGGRARGGASGAGAGSDSPAQIRFEAEARAHAAETARLTVAAQLRTMCERRRSMGGLAAVAALAMLVTSRMRGTLGMLVFSVASMLTVWGIVDVVSLSSQIATLRKRSADLLRQRDAARRVAEEASRL
ncbi:J domain-containing protein [Enorma phocaeensis]|uniref:J domain-containing protein n=1 Tax=Enorma phocaeensis TaxID=1871019 RepID=A0A921IUJ4_9ACTN|nr:J domain-containing protein [Enorma phocaeensis]HJG36941.1 J domain-containing protein [Enorma phocaeensis]